MLLPLWKLYSPKYYLLKDTEHLLFGIKKQFEEFDHEKNYI